MKKHYIWLYSTLLTITTGVTNIYNPINPSEVIQPIEERKEKIKKVLIKSDHLKVNNTNISSRRSATLSPKPKKKILNKTKHLYLDEQFFKVIYQEKVQQSDKMSGGNSNSQKNELTMIVSALVGVTLYGVH